MPLDTAVKIQCFVTHEGIILASLYFILKKFHMKISPYHLALGGTASP